MARLGWRDRWPIVAMQTGAAAGAFGMVGGQVAQQASAGQVVFTTVVALAFVGAVWLVARGAVRRLSQTGAARVPDKQPLKTVVLGLLVTAIVMWLTAGYGILVAAVSTRPENRWHALAYVGVSICASGATVIVRQARLEWAAQYLRDWPDEDP